ncbi:MAG: glycosyltransferase [Gemmatimonadales bacterium]|nr:glycosyltransferase [Gemmatimonadales bacterium]NIN13108.1 glycosyltransferase [Gemmatimonadales bacterium]NIN51192.1 glycosyltransferase [Gemmatimonadales bacterium]NIP08656.1 glycosyltransferase [Gemmatimonadales bacterium]NIR02344.1 glycosyltransferase [Gemmatimonadales bacterium]
MIYVCVTARNNASTVGLLLWKLRKVFLEFPREYHILVADDGSSDGTTETLETYQRALPMTLVRQRGGSGYGASLEALLRDALGRTDRPKRDCAVTLPASFAVSPAVLPELVKRFESGADVVVGETAPHNTPLGMRLVRWSAPWLLRPGVNLPGVRDFSSGVCAIRLITLKNCLRDQDRALLECEGPCAHAELLARAAVKARQISVIPLPAGARRALPGTSGNALALALSLYRAGRQLRIPTPTAPVQRS